MSEKLSLDVEINGFEVPSYVTIKVGPQLKQQGFKPAPQVALYDLPVRTVDALCNQFRASVFANAGLADPRAPEIYEPLVIREAGGIK